MSSRGYLLGMAVLLVMVSPMAWASWSLRQRLMPAWSGGPARLAEVVMALSMLLAVGLTLGTVGAFRPAQAALACLALGCGVAWPATRRPATPRREPPHPGDTPVSPPRRRKADLALLAMTILVAGQWAEKSLRSARAGITDGDSLYYHLPNAARFVQDAIVTAPHATVADPLSAYFPANIELFNAMAILPFHRDLLSSFLNLGWMLLALLAAWCVGLPFGAGASTTAVTTVVLATPVMLKFEAGSAQVGVGILALLLAAIALLIHAEWRLPPLCVAGLAAGLAIGSKYSMLAPVSILTIAVMVLAPQGRRLRCSAVWIGGVISTGAFWYVRNIVLIRNPLPGSDGVGPIRLPSPVSQALDRYGYSVFSYAKSASFWRGAVPGAMLSEFGLLWPALFLVAALGVVVGIVKPSSAMVRVIAVVSLIILALYVVTPFTAAGLRGYPAVAPSLRFLPPYLCLALIALVLATRRAPTAEAIVVAGSLVGLLGMAASSLSPGRLPALAVTTTAIVSASVVGTVLWRSSARRGMPAAFIGVSLAVLLVVGALVEPKLSETRFRIFGGPNGVIWAWAQGQRGERIGAVGYVANYPLYGVDLSNTVRYVGKATPNGGFSDLNDCDEFLGALSRGRYRYVVAGPVKVSRLFEPQVEPEAAWLRSQPGAAEIIREGQFSVFRLDKDVALLPGRCP